MELDKPIDTLITDVLAMDQAECLAVLRSLPPVFRDFSDEYLADQTLEQLRHIVIAASLQARKSQQRVGKR
jgi:hypothetical protein